MKGEGVRITALSGGFLAVAVLCTGEGSQAQSVEVTALPPAVEREGITGAGRAVVSGDNK